MNNTSIIETSSSYDTDYDEYPQQSCGLSHFIKTEAFTILPHLSPQIPSPSSTPRTYHIMPSIISSRRPSFVIIQELGSEPESKELSSYNQIHLFDGCSFKPLPVSRESSPSSQDMEGAQVKTVEGGKAHLSRSRLSMVQKKRIFTRKVRKSASPVRQKYFGIPVPLNQSTSYSPDCIQEILIKVNNEEKANCGPVLFKNLESTLDRRLSGSEFTLKSTLDKLNLTGGQLSPISKACKFLDRSQLEIPTWSCRSAGSVEKISSNQEAEPIISSLAGRNFDLTKNNILKKDNKFTGTKIFATRPKMLLKSLSKVMSVKSHSSNSFLSTQAMIVENPSETIELISELPSGTLKKELIKAADKIEKSGPAQYKNCEISVHVTNDPTSVVAISPITSVFTPTSTTVTTTTVAAIITATTISTVVTTTITTDTVIATTATSSIIVTSTTPTTIIVTNTTAATTAFTTAATISNLRTPSKAIISEAEKSNKSLKAIAKLVGRKVMITSNVVRALKQSAKELKDKKDETSGKIKVNENKDLQPLDMPEGLSVPINTTKIIDSSAVKTEKMDEPALASMKLKQLAKELKEKRDKTNDEIKVNEDKDREPLDIIKGLSIPFDAINIIDSLSVKVEKIEEPASAPMKLKLSAKESKVKRDETSGVIKVNEGKDLQLSNMTKGLFIPTNTTNIDSLPMKIKKIKEPASVLVESQLITKITSGSNEAKIMEEIMHLQEESENINCEDTIFKADAPNNGAIIISKVVKKKNPKIIEEESIQLVKNIKIESLLAEVVSSKKSQDPIYTISTTKTEKAKPEVTSTILEIKEEVDNEVDKVDASIHNENRKGMSNSVWLHERPLQEIIKKWSVPKLKVQSPSTSVPTFNSKVICWYCLKSKCPKCFHGAPGTQQVAQVSTITKTAVTSSSFKTVPKGNSCIRKYLFCTRCQSGKSENIETPVRKDLKRTSGPQMCCCRMKNHFKTVLGNWSCCKRKKNALSKFTAPLSVAVTEEACVGPQSENIETCTCGGRCCKIFKCFGTLCCVNLAFGVRMRSICSHSCYCCRKCICCGYRKEEAITEAETRISTISVPRRRKWSRIFTDFPKLDATFVEHGSIMRGAIPVLPVPLAWICLILNVFLPGSGTLSSGMFCLFVGKPRFSIIDSIFARIGAFVVNLFVAGFQLFTVLFCLVGWGWSIWWGVMMLKMARKNKKILISEQRTNVTHLSPMIAETHDAEKGTVIVR